MAIGGTNIFSPILEKMDAWPFGDLARRELSVSRKENRYGCPKGLYKVRALSLNLKKGSSLGERVLA